ncbi:DUF3622 domain-containing protein [Gilvimarinus sp. DA14]|uniref:DUF3622 domain-containing protein n=1 Tax=Gilvimarinus sp. DA14 TaxID=2956798 RepID=UPI0020B6C2E6|nr:DUF3622 domain-containing protein [Gilvimarinus sp. DA14]UTF61628.1 DUF3622 domain-containing protein [Gilvimarinus sp. DA14]
MATGKKFDYRVSESNGNWSAEITRRASARNTVTTKAQDGFASEAEAVQWAENELKTIIENVRARQDAKR